MSNLYFLAAQVGGGSGLALFAPVLLIFGVFYFLLILPQQRRQKKWQQMLADLKTGDKVVTSGGLKGTIFSMKEDSVTLRVPPDNLKLDVSRGSIVTVTTSDEATSSK
ncbi:MAG: preprotein translocase subunit YajC [Terriglobales bacterium]